MARQWRDGTDTTPSIPNGKTRSPPRSTPSRTAERSGRQTDEGRFVVLFALLVALRPAHGRYYDDRNYGIHVELPGDKSVCLTDPPGSNHGLIILLHSSDCSHPVKAARIEIYVGSNVPFEAETTAELAKHLCAGQADEPTHLML